MRLPGLFVGGGLQGEKGKVYKVSDLEGLILHAAFVLAEIDNYQEVVADRLTQPFREIELRLTSLVHDSCESGISPKKEGRELSSALTSLREKLLAKAPQDLDLDYPIKTLIIYFCYHVPDAPSTVIASHVGNIVKTMTGTSHDDLPAQRTIRRWVTEQRKAKII